MNDFLSQLLDLPEFVTFWTIMDAFGVHLFLFASIMLILSSGFVAVVKLMVPDGYRTKAP